ncbi:MAG: DUF3151 domain-containing protein [Actinomycetes bacterium]
MSRTNLLGGLEPTLLPADHADVDAAQRLAAGEQAERLAAANPASSLAWAVLSEEASARGDDVTAYAFARTGYHRGLDALRRAGWRGQGPVPYSHEANRGVLRAVRALAAAAGAIGEDDEQRRGEELLRECDPAAKDLMDAASAQ